MSREAFGCEWGGDKDDWVAHRRHRPARNRWAVSGGFFGFGAMVSLGRRRRATGRPKEMGKKDPGEPDFGLRAHSTEWWGPGAGRPSGHPAGPIRGLVRPAVRPDSGVGPARLSAWPATGLATSAGPRSGPRTSPRAEGRPFGPASPAASATERRGQCAAVGLGALPAPLPGGAAAPDDYRCLREAGTADRATDRPPLCGEALGQRRMRGV